MESVYIVGSFKRYAQMQAAQAALKEAGIDARLSNPHQPDGVDGCLARIQCSDVIYVFNDSGYVGKSVALDVGYALALKKTIYSLEPLTDPDVGHLTAGVVTIAQLVAIIKSEHIKSDQKQKTS